MVISSLSRFIAKNFAGSLFISLAALIFVYVTMGWQAALVTLVLMVIEITFSFDNAIVNARVLNTMNLFWQRMFMTIGILVAVFGMRIVFPIVIVMITADMSWGTVMDLALNNPDAYSAALHDSHTSIASFGSMFLLMLGLHYFFDKTRLVHWWRRVEVTAQQFGHWWLPSVLCAVILVIVANVPANTHPEDTLVAGSIGIGTYLAITGISAFFTRQHEKAEKKAGKKMLKAGMAGLSAFLYLEVLDASFSLDGVIGAFAITQNVVLIAIGLGVGAVWVRSMTLYMVRHKVLHAYRYLEHGAHYTILILALVFLSSLFAAIPEAIAGVAGVVIIISSIVASRRAERRDEATRIAA